MESFPPVMCEGIKHMSESVFVVLCQIIGTSQQVTIRRETRDILDVVRGRSVPYDELVQMLDGSRREGFRLEGSDIDFMLWPKNHRVIMDMFQFECYNTANTTLILSDSSESPPGFTLLQLLTPTRYSDVKSACVRSSSMWREIGCSAAVSNSTVHGPCGSGNLAGFEYDTAICLACDFWPPSASSWIDMSLMA
nr:uncharacterized protein LOC117684169 [Crassostrea gigas]